MKGWAEFLLLKGADPNRVGTDRFAPLIQAIISGKTDDVAALLRYHVDTTVKYIKGGEDYTPLELALYEDNPKIADLLYSQNTDLNSKDNKGRTPLQRAVQKGQKQSVEWLLKHGAKE
jgi:ankyrin repeat protein